MKIRLTQKGFDTYTGQMGVVFFENGLSINDVLHVDAIRLSAVMTCEWENGQPCSIAQRLLDEANTPAPLGRVTETPAPEAPKEPGELYTEAELGAIADAEGIGGIRAIAEPLGIKGNSINALIQKLLDQGVTKAA